jgi:hypothetical protein
LPGFVIAALIGLGGFLIGVLLSLTALRGRRAPTPGQLDPPLVTGELPEAEVEEEVEIAAASSLPLTGQLAAALRRPLASLRRVEAPPGVLAQLERVAWQARMLSAGPRPMKSVPSSPISLLQEAAEQVELLRLGKVAVSWSLLTRQPVQVDPERARGALRELLTAGAEAAGEGNRLAIRVHAGERAGYPVVIEIEIARRGAELDLLAYCVARHLLESQGAAVDLDAGLVRVHLKS